MKEVTIPESVYNAMQSEIHDIRGVLGKTGRRIELLRMREPGANGAIDHLFVLNSDAIKDIERYIQQWRLKDYRT